MANYTNETHPAWMTDAACARVGGDFWFPEKDGSQRELSLAKRICWEECPVRAECEQYASDTRQEYGIWGGKNRLNSWWRKWNA